MPINVARSTPAASITVITSSVHSSRVGIAPTVTGSERPQPRLSNVSTRANASKRRRKRDSSGCSQRTS